MNLCQNCNEKEAKRKFCSKECSTFWFNNNGKYSWSNNREYNYQKNDRWYSKEENKELAVERASEWNQANPDKCRKYSRKHREKKKTNGET